MRNLICGLLWLPVSFAVTPTAEIGVAGVKVLVVPAAFGASLPQSSKRMHLTVVRPSKYQDGCHPVVQVPTTLQSSGFALFVQRSPNCTFEDRALAAQKAGASALIVANTVEGIYRNRSHGDDLDDYDCTNGKGYVSSISSDGGKLEGFPLSSCATDDRCGSRRCILTDSPRSTATSSQDGLRICCAWDSFMTMASSPAPTPVTIPSVFVTMVGADSIAAAAPSLFEPVASPSSSPSSLSASSSVPSAAVTMYLRSRPFEHLSSILMWALGCATAFYASWVSCEDLRRAHRLSSDSGSERRSGGDAFRADTDADENAAPPLELSGSHAVGFMVIASVVLVVLFYIDLDLVVTGLFCLSAASAVAAVLFRGACGRCLGQARATRVVATSAALGHVTCLDALSLGAGATLAVAWFFTRSWWGLAFALQDVFGCCLCVLFLGSIRLPDLKVATLLLCMAFSYDVFFVFLSPLVFHESVMVKVAVGTQPTADPSFCEKYPSASECASEELPMLLLLPRLLDFEGGYTMLGLGDIVIPGLLLSFACRFDLTRRQRRPWGGVGSARGWGSSCFFPEYWLMLCAGYAVGLACANLAVVLSGMGQPALLYLVPCTLAPLLLKAKRDGTLSEMWEGPSEGSWPGGGAAGTDESRDLKSSHGSYGGGGYRGSVGDTAKGGNYGSYHLGTSMNVSSGTEANESSSTRYSEIAGALQEGEPLLVEI